MARLPAHDGRLMHLGEAQDLLEYAREMQELLKYRWEQQAKRVATRCEDAGYTQDEYEGEYQFEEYQHSKYEIYLDGQLVISAWSVLQGAVEYCAAFLAEKLGIDSKLSAVRFGRKPAEAHWEYFYTEKLGVPWPLSGMEADIAALRSLRNDYGHSLFFEPFSVRARLAKVTKGLDSEISDLYYRVSEFAALQGQGVPACELIVTLVERLKRHAESVVPHDGVSISFWDRSS